MLSKQMIAAMAAVIALGAGVVVWLERPGPDEGHVLLTPEAKVYTRSLQLSDVEIKAAESYLKQELVEIQGRLTNRGDRVLKLVEINCVFRDPYGQVVLRERVAIAGRKMGDLAPGQVQNFRLAFDNIPGSWNKSLPDLVIARIVFG